MEEGSNRWQGSTESGELRAPHTHLLATARPALKTPCLPEPDAQSTSAELGCHGFKCIRQKEGKEKAGGAFSALYVGASQAVHQEITIRPGRGKEETARLRRSAWTLGGGRRHLQQPCHAALAGQDSQAPPFLLPAMCWRLTCRAGSGPPLSQL